MIARTFTLAFLSALLSWPTCLAQETPNSITFAIDMQAAIADGMFDPAQHEVGLRGSHPPLSWGQTLPLTDDDGDGIYIVTVAFDAELVDSVQVAYKVKIDYDGGNDGWETGRNRSVTLTGAAQTIARAYNQQPEALPESFSGTIIKHLSVPSAYLDANRDVFVYVPPGYAEEPDRRYPVFYMHDGRNVFDASEVGAEWRVDETAQRLIRDGIIEPVIIVGVGNTPNRTIEYTPTPSQFTQTWSRLDEPQPLIADDTLQALTGRYRIDDARTVIISVRDGALFTALEGQSEPSLLQAVGPRRYFFSGQNAYFTFDTNADGLIHQITMNTQPSGGKGMNYGRFLVNELMPFINSEYRTLTGPAFTAVGGSSLGGLISMYLGLEYPDVFGHLAVLSPSVWWDQRIIVDMVEAKPKTDQRIWLDMGTAEGATMLDGARVLKTALEAKGWQEGVDLAYMEDEGAQHNETAWAGRAEAFLRFLFGQP